MQFFSCDFSSPSLSPKKQRIKRKPFKTYSAIFLRLITKPENSRIYTDSAEVKNKITKKIQIMHESIFFYLLKLNQTSKAISCSADHIFLKLPTRDPGSGPEGLPSLSEPFLLRESVLSSESTEGSWDVLSFSELAAKNQKEYNSSKSFFS